MTDEEYVRAARRKAIDALAREEMEQGLYDRAEKDEERLEQIRQLEEEITFTTIAIDDAYRNCGDEGCGCDNPWKRIRARLESALADLKRGMRG